MEKACLPYTYLIGWKKLNLWYYGVRISRNCNPADLWVTYFTSSKYVTEIVKTHGAPDVVQIRKTFDNPIDAVKWEITVLRRMKVLSDSRFLNKNIGGAILQTAEVCKKISDTHQKNKKLKTNNPMSGKRWITDGIQNKVISKNTTVPNGWVTGRTMVNDTVVEKTMWITDGFNNKRVPLDFKIEDGWKKGHPIKGTIWITNGVNNKRVSLDFKIEDGWRKGHTVKDKDRLRSSSRYMWITNGHKSIKIPRDSLIPDGWKRGYVNGD